MAAIRLRVVSNFGDGDSGMSEIHARGERQKLRNRRNLRLLAD